MRKFLTKNDPVVPMNHPSMLVDEAIAQGASEAALLFGTGVSRPMLTNADARITLEQFGTLIENALLLTGNPGLGLDVGRRAHLSHLGLLGLLIMSSANGAEAFESGLKYYRSISPGWDVELHVDGALAVITAREVIPCAVLRFSTEALMVGMREFAASLMPDFMHGVHELRLRYPEPEYAERYRRLFPHPIRYECEQTQVLFDAEMLTRPLPTAHQLTAAWAERECAARMPTETHPKGVVQQIQTLLEQSRGNYPDLETLARNLQTSERSLNRALRGMGTSYQSLLDEARRKHAIEYVAGTTASCERIARELAFSDARSFRRAFRRWTGLSPAEYRSTQDVA